MQEITDDNTFGYDDQGRRVFTDRADNVYFNATFGYGSIDYLAVANDTISETLTQELYDGDGAVRAYAESGNSNDPNTSGNLVMTAEYIRGSDWGSSAGSEQAGGIGGILYSLPASGNATTAKYYHYDGRGDVVALTGNTGNVTYAAEYNAFGTHATSLNATTNVTTTGTQEVGTDTDPFRTNTREEFVDADGNGWVNEGHRVRDLNTDTYLTPDPLGFAGGSNNFYNYVNDNPWTKTDPEGEDAKQGLEAGAVAGTAGLELGPLDIAVIAIAVVSGGEIATHPNMIHAPSGSTGSWSTPSQISTQPSPTALPPSGPVQKQPDVTPGQATPAIPNNTGGTPAAPLPNTTPGGSTPPLPITTPPQQVSPSGSAMTPDIMNSVIQGGAAGGNSGSGSKKNPNTGVPGSTVTLYNPDGTPKQVRQYGPDGKPQGADIDYGHGHELGPDGKPIGSPHAHDWTPDPDGGYPNRSLPRPVQPSDPTPQQKTP
jgi:RHS repeat-associated protein